jgi:penicillin-binding protein 1A
MPPAGPNGEGTPPSTAVVMGQISGAPRRVHWMSSVVLASLLGQRGKQIGEPTLIKAYDHTAKEAPADTVQPAIVKLRPREVMTRGSEGLVKALLSAPLCYSANKTSHGTLKNLASWCASRKSNVRLHFAKSGTQVTEDPDASIDSWITGGVQFANGAAYSYVVLVGTGSVREPFARKLHGGDLAPLAEALLKDLEVHARSNPAPKLLPTPPAPPKPSTPVAAVSRAPANIATGARRERSRAKTPNDLVRQSLSQF